MLANGMYKITVCYVAQTPKPERTMTVASRSSWRIDHIISWDQLKPKAVKNKEESDAQLSSKPRISKSKKKRTLESSESSSKHIG